MRLRQEDYQICQESHHVLELGCCNLLHCISFCKAKPAHRRQKRKSLFLLQPIIPEQWSHYKVYQVKERLKWQ